jgi:hypothetical protein
MSDTICKFDVEVTLRVDELMNGIVSVSKLKIVFETFEVNPAHVILVVVTAFETYKLPVTWRFEVAVVDDPIDTPGT